MTKYGVFMEFEGEVNDDYGDQPIESLLFDTEDSAMEAAIGFALYCLHDSIDTTGTHDYMIKVDRPKMTIDLTYGSDTKAHYYVKTMEA